MKLRTLETLKISEQETENHETQSPNNKNTRNQETNKPIHLSLYPSTYRRPPLHQTTFLGDTTELGGHEWSPIASDRLFLVGLNVSQSNPSKRNMPRSKDTFYSLDI